MNNIALWEILVPTERSTRARDINARENALATENLLPSKQYYTTRYHRVWDAKVRAITGGLTIMTPARGQWVAPDGKLFAERMIPVRIAATREQIEKIIDMTIVYYDQEAVLCYKLSDEVILKQRK